MMSMHACAQVDGGGLIDSINLFSGSQKHLHGFFQNSEIFTGVIHL